MDMSMRFALLLLPILLSACLARDDATRLAPPSIDTSFAVGDTLTRMTGTVIQLLDTSDFYVIQPDGMGALHFVTDLPDDYKKDSLRITFSGVVESIPLNERLTGIPLKLVRIDLLN